MYRRSSTIYYSVTAFLVLVLNLDIHIESKMIDHSYGKVLILSNKGDHDYAKVVKEPVRSKVDQQKLGKTVKKFNGSSATTSTTTSRSSTKSKSTHSGTGSMNDHNYSKVLNEMNKQVELVNSYRPIDGNQSAPTRNGIRKGVSFSYAVKHNLPSATTMNKTSKAVNSGSSTIQTNNHAPLISKAMPISDPCKKNPNSIFINDKENCDQFADISQSNEVNSDKSLNSYQIQNVPGDGNCFFHCLSLKMFGDCKNSSNIRTNTCGFVLQNWASMENKVKLHHSITNRAQYAQSMIYRNGYATACEIEAASIYYQREINIWLRNTQNNQIVHTKFIPNIENSNCPIDILLEKEHFQLLRHKDKSPVLNLKRPNNSQIVQKIKKAKKPTVSATNVIDSSKSVQSQKCTHNQQTNILIDSNTFSQSNVHKSPKSKPVSNNHAFVDHKSENSQNKTNDSNEANSLNANENQSVEKSSSEGPIISKHKSQVSVTNESILKDQEELLKSQSRRLGLTHESPTQDENYTDRIKRQRKIKEKIRRKTKTISNISEIPPPPPPSDDSQFDKAMDSIRNFELQEMNYNIDFCKICNERRIDMKMSIDDICKRCATDKSQIKQFSTENNMNPGILPKELSNLSILEQQLICRISPCINVHLLKHGGIGSSGHCVTFPQDINQPAQIFPRLPKEISIIRVRKQGKNDTSKEFRVRRQTIENALLWLKNNNPAYSDIYISQDRLLTIPIDGELQNIETLEYSSDDNLLKDNGPAPEQLIDTDIVTGETHSTMMLPDTVCNISEKVKMLLKM